MKARNGLAHDDLHATLHSDLLERVRTTLAASGQVPTPAQVAAVLRSAGAGLGDAHVLEITERLRSELIGAGPLDVLIGEPGVTDILVNGPDDVWADRGRGLERITDVRFPDDESVRALAQRLATTAGRRLDDAVPFVDAQLPAGVRLHAVVPPIAPDGTHISLRVPAAQTLQLDDLVASGSVPADLEPWVRAIVRTRLGFLVTGGTGSGKTTVLGALLSIADREERIVLVEDSAELRPDHPHVVRLEGRPANVENSGRVDLATLVRQALRMRPDRIVVGEARGSEIVDLFAAMNTGHEGGCGTLHANSPADVPARIEALGIAAGLSRDAIHTQATAAINVVLHLTRAESARRHLAQIAVTTTQADGHLHITPAYVVDNDGVASAGPGLADLASMLSERGWAP
jgi:pilus assembly protein CpaF